MIDNVQELMTNSETRDDHGIHYDERLDKSLRLSIRVVKSVMDRGGVRLSHTGSQQPNHGSYGMGDVRIEADHGRLHGMDHRTRGLLAYRRNEK